MADIKLLEFIIFHINEIVTKSSALLDMHDTKCKSTHLLDHCIAPVLLPAIPNNNMAEEEEVVEPLHLEFEDREVYLAKIPVRAVLSVSVRKTLLRQVALETRSKLHKPRNMTDACGWI